ncbi:hypothetical protein [Wolbachia endosymbiont (group A) of Bibio marci]|nr:hypothetical protein [Wolbachia endosymbiont (group A) of Bibio marci]
MIFIVNYYQYKVRCNKAHWDPVFITWCKVKFPGFQCQALE